MLQGNSNLWHHINNMDMELSRVIYLPPPNQHGVDTISIQVSHVQLLVQSSHSEDVVEDENEMLELVEVELERGSIDVIVYPVDDIAFNHTGIGIDIEKDNSRTETQQSEEGKGEGLENLHDVLSLAVNEDEAVVLPRIWLSDVDADASNAIRGSMAQNSNGDPEAPFLGDTNGTRSNDNDPQLMVDLHLSCRHGTLKFVHDVEHQNSNIPTPRDGVHVEVTDNIITHEDLHVYTLRLVGNIHSVNALLLPNAGGGSNVEYAPHSNYHGCDTATLRSKQLVLLANANANDAIKDNKGNP
jgi:hypothetical protein